MHVYKLHVERNVKHFSRYKEYNERNTSGDQNSLFAANFVDDQKVKKVEIGLDLCFASCLQL